MEEEISENPLEEVMQHSNIEIKLDVQNLIINNKRGEASEILVDKIKKDNKFYTIRDDDREEVWAYQNGIYIPNGLTLITEKIREIMGENITSQLKNQVILKIETDTYINQKEFFDQNIKEEIVVNNGILNLETQELTPYTDKKIFFTKIPHKYDPEKECHTIIKFLKEILKYEEDIHVIQELFGYLLWKEYNIERAIMLIGSGRNGKSKAMDLMKRFIGPENCSSVKLQNLEGDNFNSSNLHKKLANLCGDIDDKSLKYTGSFKELTGRDLITANRKFKTSIHFENYAKLVFSANQLPKTRDLSDAFFMRWIVLEFPYTFVKQEEFDQSDSFYVKLRDPDIINKISNPEEMSGLLNWSLIGLKRLQDRKDFSYNKSTEEVRNMWIRKSDSFKAFVMDKIKEGFGLQIEKSELQHHYHNYCIEYDLKPVGDKSIRYTLTTEHGAYDKQIMVDGDRVRVWIGIELKNDEEVDDSDQRKLEKMNNVRDY